jgi:hypothetical protein
MSVISKSAFSKALPEELNICIVDYLCGTQAQWRIVFQESLELIGNGRLCQPYCHRLRRRSVYILFAMKKKSVLIEWDFTFD